MRSANPPWERQRRRRQRSANPPAPEVVGDEILNAADFCAPLPDFIVPFFEKSDNSWQKSSTNYVLASYLQPLLLWTGALLVCRALDPVVLPTEASQIVKQRLLNFVRSLSTGLAFAYCLSRWASSLWGKLYTLQCGLLLSHSSWSCWVSQPGNGSLLEGLVLCWLNLLVVSAMIHATQPFVANEWVQTKIEGYEVSGTVEHVGWWLPAIISGEDCETVHIPNDEFTVSVVRKLEFAVNVVKKTHWWIKLIQSSVTWM